MKKINIRLKCITIIWLTYFLFVSETKAQTIFSPLHISGLKLWLSGDSISIANPPFIDKCFDLSSAANHAMQTSLTIKPSSANSILNGHKIMRFDGIDDLLNFNAIPDIRTVFWVLKENNSATSTNRPLLGSSSGYDFYRGDNQEIWSSAYTNNFILSGSTRLNSVAVNGSTAILPQQFSIVSLVTTGNVSADNLSKDRTNANRVWDGDFAELIIYNKPLSAPEVKQVEDYLRAKYAPSVNLGADHTVCSLPLILKAGKSYFTKYKWQDNSNADTLIVSNPGTYYVTTTDVFNNISSDTIVISKDTLAYTVKLGNDTSICNGESVVIRAGPSHFSYLWSTGSLENAISVNASGKYSVSVTDCFGNISKDTISINVHPIPVFSLGKDTLVCFNSSYIIDPGFSNSIPLTFRWHDSKTDSVHTVLHGGVFSLNVKDNIGCSFSDTVIIKMDSLLSTATLGADTTFCSGNIIELKAGSMNAVSYLWSTGSTNNSIPITNSGKYWLTVNSINNCSVTDTINIVISGVAPMGNFSYSNTCIKNTTVFNDLSTPSTGETLISWKWDFGDSFTSISQHPTHVYADTGKYVARLTVTSSGGCSVVLTKIVHIYPRPAMNFLSSLLCEDINISFTGQATVYNYPITQWNWNFADPGSGIANVSAAQNPIHLFKAAGIYPITLVGVSIQGCSDTLTKNIVIHPAPTTDFDFSLPCKDDTVLFKDMTVIPTGTTNTGNYWNFGNGTSFQLNPKHIFPVNITYTVMHAVTASNGCKDTVIKKVDVHASPTARFNNTPSCELSPTSFSDLSLIPADSITGWAWNFEGKAVSALKNPQHSFTKAGNLIVKLVVASNYGCKDSVTKTIVVNPKPVAQFSHTPTYGNPGLVVKFTNTSTGAFTYSWNFDNGATSTFQHPSAIYADTGQYAPFLIAISNYGCSDTAVSKVIVLKRFMDIAIKSVTTELQNSGLLLNNYLSARLEILNKSTSDVFAIDFYLEANNGTAIKESWTGKLIKGGTMSYDFKATPTINNADHFVCMYALKPNGLTDEVQVDNKICKALDVSMFKVLEPYPNPTEEMMTIPLIIPTGGNLAITIYDSRGNEIKKAFKGTTTNGLQLIPVDMRECSSGLYLFKVELEDQTIIKKFIKK